MKICPKCGSDIINLNYGGLFYCRKCMKRMKRVKRIVFDRDVDRLFGEEERFLTGRGDIY